MSSAAGAAPPPTKLQQAFGELRGEGRLLVEENCACCGTCGHRECSILLEASPDKVGFVFFHSQNVDLAADTGRLYLSHTARDTMPPRVPPLVACQVLRDHGFQVEWDGTLETCIQVHVPEGPERQYFQRMLDETCADVDEEWQDEEEG